MAKLNLSYQPIFHYQFTSYSGDMMAMPSSLPLFSAKPSEVYVTVECVRSEKEINSMADTVPSGRAVPKTYKVKMPLTSPLLKAVPSVGQVLSRLT